MRALPALLAILAAGAFSAGMGAPAPKVPGCTAIRAGWATRAEGVPHHAIVNRIAVSRDGRLIWNGAPVTRDTLRQYLELVRNMEPMPFTILVPARGADCALVEAIRDDMEAALPCREGACGEGRGRWGDAVPLPRSGTGIDPELDAAANAAAADTPNP